MATAKSTNTKAKPKKGEVKKKKKVSVSPKVKVMVHASYNNTIVSIVDYDGNVVAGSSGGVVGFTGTRKSTAYAATKAGQDAASKAVKIGAQEAVVIIKGIGEGRNAAVKGIRAAGLKITSLSDHTPVPHGGVKPRKMPKK